MSKLQIARIICKKCDHSILSKRFDLKKSFFGLGYRIWLQVTCTECNCKFTEDYGWDASKYFKEVEQECKCPTCNITNERLELIEDD